MTMVSPEPVPARESILLQNITQESESVLFSVGAGHIRQGEA